MKISEVSRKDGQLKFQIYYTWEEFDKAINQAYQSTKSRYRLDGFRPGKAPRAMIESHFGKDVFYEDAINKLLEHDYFDGIDSLQVEPISQPMIEMPDIQEGKSVSVTGTVSLFPEIDVKNYKGLKIEKLSTKITETEVKEELEALRRKQARLELVTDRPTEDGDTVIMDFEGSVDGVPFDGGKADNYELKLGSGQFIPGFEPQLVGKKPEEEIKVEVKFPDQYTEELAGKDAVFMCKIHEIKREVLPDINDELISDTTEYETLADYKKFLKKRLQDEAKDKDESIMKDRALEELYKANKVDTPAVMVQNELDNMIYDMKMQLFQQGIKFEDYTKWLGKTESEMREESRPEAVKRINTRILLRNIIRLEKIDATEEEVDEHIAEFGKQYGQSIDEVKKNVGASNLKYFKEDVQTKKAIQLIFDKAEKTPVEIIRDKSN